MKRNERKKYVPALAILLILWAIFAGAEASAEEKSVISDVQEIVTRFQQSIPDEFTGNNGLTPEEKENGGWKGGDPSCEHLNISWVSDGNLRHHAVCDDCGAEGPERAHTARYVSKTKTTHRRECILCRQALGEERPHMITYANDGQKEHKKICYICGLDTSEPHKLVCANDGEKGHHRQCTACGAVTSEEPHKLKIRNFGIKGHYAVCSECSYISPVESHALTCVSHGGSGHQWQCTVCSYKNAEESHTITWISLGEDQHQKWCSTCGFEFSVTSHQKAWKSDGLAGHHVECTDCGIAWPMEPHSWVATSKGAAGHNLKCTVCGESTSQTEPHDWIWINEGPAGHRGKCEQCGYSGTVEPHTLRTTKDGTFCSVCSYEEIGTSRPKQENEPVSVEAGKPENGGTGEVVAEKPEGQQDQDIKTDIDTQIQQLEEKISNYSEQEKELLKQFEEIFRQQESGEIDVDEALRKTDEIIAGNEEAEKIHLNFLTIKSLKAAKESLISVESGGDTAEKPESQPKQEGETPSSDELKEVEERVSNYSEKEAELLRQFEEVYKQFDNGEISHAEAVNKLNAIRNSDNLGEKVFDDSQVLRWKNTGETIGVVAEKPESQPKQESETPIEEMLEPKQETVSIIELTESKSGMDEEQETDTEAYQSITEFQGPITEQTQEKESTVGDVALILEADESGILKIKTPEGLQEQNGGADEAVADKPESRQDQNDGKAENAESDDQVDPGFAWSHPEPNKQAGSSGEETKKITTNGKTYQVITKKEEQTGNAENTEDDSTLKTPKKKTKKRRLNTPKTVSIQDVPGIRIGGSGANEGGGTVADKPDDSRSKTTQNNFNQVINYTLPIGGNTVYLQDNRGSGR